MPSTAQVQGRNLVPFTFDKQVLFMETVYSIFGSDTIPAGLMNFSDWRAAEAATSISSKCADPLPAAALLLGSPTRLPANVLHAFRVAQAHDSLTMQLAPAHQAVCAQCIRR